MPHVSDQLLQNHSRMELENREAMKNDTGLRLVDMRVDGGMTVNNLLMQMQVLWLSVC